MHCSTDREARHEALRTPEPAVQTPTLLHPLRRPGSSSTAYGKECAIEEGQQQLYSTQSAEWSTALPPQRPTMLHWPQHAAPKD
jgi:hypothetical protein